MEWTRKGALDGGINLCSVCCILGSRRGAAGAVCPIVGDSGSESICSFWSLPSEKLPVSILSAVSDQSPLQSYQLHPAQRYADGRDWVPRWIKCQPCAASRTPSPLPGVRDPCVYPHCTYTVKKLWASVSTSKAALAAALEMEPDNFGYEWLVCSWGWNYCWWRSCTDGVMSSAQTGRNLSCGRTTSKQSRARRSGLLHWCSLKRSQLLPSGMAVCVLRRLLIEMGKKCGTWFNKEKKEEMCTLRYHCIPFQSQQIACAVRGRPFGGAGWDVWLYLWIRRSSTGRNPQLGFWFGCSMQWLEQ